MNDKICLITGATSGIGKKTALGLAEKGATLVMAVRNEKKAKKVQNMIKSQTNNTNIDYLLVDLARQDEVHTMVTNFKKQYAKLDVLINNAGIMLSNRTETAEGIEKTLAVNHLAPFLLTNLLFEKLQASSAARIINISSGLHKKVEENFLDDIQSERNYNGMQTYYRTKFLNILFTYELDRRLQKHDIQNITVNAVHPGFVSTNLGVEGGTFFNRYIFNYLIRPIIGISPEQGAKTSIYVASESEIQDVSGKYFYKKKVKSTSDLTHNEEMQDQLWKISQELTGLEKTPV